MTPSVLELAADLTNDIFGRHVDFACLTGSAAERTASDADIDLIAVLKPATPLDQAVRMRIDFSAAYGRLHRRFNRRPDLEWPGEVLFTPDLVIGRAGAAFQRSGSSVIKPAPLDTPWRYWISMIMSGTAIAGHVRHADEAARCARAILRQQLSAALPGGGQIRVSELLAAATWWDQWRLPTGRSSRGRLVVDRATGALAGMAAERDIDLQGDVVSVTADQIEHWARSLEPPPAAPALDAYQPQFRLVASQAYREGSLLGEGGGR